MDKELKKRIVSRMPISKPCSYCGDPMLQARGNVIQELDNVNGKNVIVRQTQNNDQRVLYHKKCRTEGRRLARKAEKNLIKLK